MNNIESLLFDRCTRCGGWGVDKPKPLRFLRCICPSPTLPVRHVAACEVCGITFGARVPSAYCSKSCRWKAKGCWISPAARLAIYERDDWTCHICGDPVNRVARVPELDAPTIDHVIARAMGGGHMPSNLKTAHFYCNSLKRDLPLEEVA